MFNLPQLMVGSNRYPRTGVHDALASVLSWRLWLVLGIREVNSYYQRAFIGPAWLTVHAGVWIAAVTFIFGFVIGLDESTPMYAAHVAVGIVMFHFITNIVAGSSEVFIKSRIMIHSHPNPLLIHPMRLVASAVYEMALQLPVIIAVFMIFQTSLTPTAWLAIPGLMMNFVMGVAVALLFALAGARFGDFRFVTLAGMRLALFITPVFWPADRLGPDTRFIADANPFTHFIAIVRDPLLGEPAPMLAWITVLAWFALCAVVGGAWFASARRTIPMWV
ncbi:ABC transporter permease [Maricaulis sp.]|uniref:ABC transporter permease n=1 Tax=Maricaulis sp. TaxID=1486257 RepID=UPI002B2661BC|nr:ABC transporter permease [Maricaulis sp.]